MKHYCNRQTANRGGGNTPNNGGTSAQKSEKLCRANQKAAENSARIISRREAFIFLYSEAVKSDDDPEYNKKLLGKIDSITQNTKMIRLSCLPDQSAAEYLLRFTDDTRLTEDS